jgi:hypothetical protein
MITHTESELRPRIDWLQVMSCWWLVYKTSIAKEENYFVLANWRTKKKWETKLLSTTAARGEEIIQNFVLYSRTSEQKWQMMWVLAKYLETVRVTTLLDMLGYYFQWKFWLTSQQAVSRHKSGKKYLAENQKRKCSTVASRSHQWATSHEWRCEE